jgi:integrase
MQIKYSYNFLLEQRKDKKTGQLITENVPINVDITFSGKRLRFYIGYRIDETKWDEPKQKVDKNTYNADRVSSSEINKRITNVASAIDSTFNYFIGIEKYPTLHEVRDLIKEKLKVVNKNVTANGPEPEPIYDLFDCYSKYIKEARVSPLRRKQLESTKNHFEKFNSELTFDNVNSSTLKAFQEYLKTPKKDEKGKKELIKGQNTISCIMKKLRAFFSYALKNRWTKTNPFNEFHIEPEKYGDPVFITKEELDKLYSAELPDDQLIKVRDLFVLQCHLGCRIGDYKNLTRKNIIKGAIEYIPSKTSNEREKVLRVPLSKKALSIIKKYDYLGDSLMPFIPDQIYNGEIKRLFRTANITRNVVKLNTQTRKNEIVCIATLASSHMARRTFIGLLHKHVKNEIIASMSGHVENSKAFSRYYNIDDNDKRNAVTILD